jgi:ATP-dependent Clp protease ATP-binding subunit ClpC
MSSIQKLLKQSRLYPVLLLETYFDSRNRAILIQATKYFIFSLPVIIILAVIFGDYSAEIAGKSANVLIEKVIGFGLLSFSLFLSTLMFEAYFASTYYFEYVARNRYLGDETYTFSAGRIMRRAMNGNLYLGLLKSKTMGKRILYRLGIDPEQIASQIENEEKRALENIKSFTFDPNKIIKVADIIDHVYQNYPEFKKLLTDHGVNQSDLTAATGWVVYEIESAAYDRQWWKPEKLAKIPGVAADWSFGRTYLLSRFGRNIFDDKEVNSTAIAFDGRSRELAQIQAIMDRSDNANALLVGEPGQEKMEVVWNLARQIKEKRVSSSLQDKKLVLFLANNFTSVIDNKEDFEDKLQTIFAEALGAGNIVLVIDNLPRLILEAKQFDLNLNEIIEPYISGISGKVIALADTEYYHSLIHNDTALMSHFETVMTKPLLLDEITKIIAREALAAEKIYEIIYTYPAVVEIAKSAEYYFPDGVSSDKAKDLLSEMFPWAVEKGINIVGRNHVLTYVSEKTNIPVAEVTEIEKDKLLNLENLLVKRVIAQREAVFAVSSAIRRNRAGIRNENRPIGSFLFLGPTGVGKTETAKALAEVIFNSEETLLRLDMSEYQNEESLGRLIGSIEENSQGTLATMLRDHPYGVLLLDEFEKTHKKVLNLFLQIIDEGYFTDAFGKKVMARNIIFIATSNAGATKIFDIVSSGQNLLEKKDEIISTIIRDEAFKPELINRFDATVIFHPLSQEDMLQIAKLMLKKVAKRLEKKGVTFEYSPEVISFVATNGYNPTFGARPLTRFIQDTIEEHLSNLIIRQELVAGQTIGFKVTDNRPVKESLEPIIS